MANPQTFLIGVTAPCTDGIDEYLKATGQEDFRESWNEAIADHVPASMCLVSFYAKLCYRSLVLGKNANVSRVRDIEDNVVGCFSSGHGSVFEHVWLNFVTTNCSRVFTHELVRHRVGTAFSQTSGRYCSVGDAELVLPTELVDDYPEIALEMQSTLESLKGDVERWRGQLGLDDEPDFARKKRFTSALRRIMPNGATNEIGWSCNVRALRHMIEMRTSRHAEWEIRVVFSDVAQIIAARWPLMLHGGDAVIVDGLEEWTGLSV